MFIENLHVLNNSLMKILYDQTTETSIQHKRGGLYGSVKHRNT